MEVFMNFKKLALMVLSTMALLFSHHVIAASKRKKLSDDTRKSLIEVLKVNEQLHQSFFKYDKNLVEQNARKLKDVIGKIKNEEVSKLLSFSRKQLGEIKSSHDRGINNNHYNLVSMALIHIVNTYDLGSKYNSYSCPMVKKKWIQNSAKMAKVHNPYAPQMPHCGSKDSNY